MWQNCVFCLFVLWVWERVPDRDSAEGTAWVRVGTLDRSLMYNQLPTYLPTYMYLPSRMPDKRHYLETDRLDSNGQVTSSVSKSTGLCFPSLLPALDIPPQKPHCRCKDL
jgi:hypothetical protein